jgi:hypothetical protein
MTEASYKVPKNITAPSPLAPAESESSIANSDSEALDINAGDYEDLPEPVAQGPGGRPVYYVHRQISCAACSIISMRLFKKVFISWYHDIFQLHSAVFK